MPANSFLTYPMICRKGGALKLLPTRTQGRASGKDAQNPCLLFPYIPKDRQSGEGVKIIAE
ncbi:hypothetical protein CYR52_20420 [Chimaeribacter arupi]|nr:hypothetical protein CYR52_20420 [Chimaeribacter arupi]